MLPGMAATTHDLSPAPPRPVEWRTRMGVAPRAMVSTYKCRDTLCIGILPPSRGGEPRPRCMSSEADADRVTLAVGEEETRPFASDHGAVVASVESGPAAPKLSIAQTAWTERLTCHKAGAHVPFP